MGGDGSNVPTVVWRNGFDAVTTVVLNQRITACSQSQWRLAKELWSLAYHRRIANVITYGSTMRVLLPWSSTLSILSLARQQVVEPNVVLFNTAITLCPDWTMAFLVVASMRSHSVSADVLSFNSLIAKEAKVADQWQFGLVLLHGILPRALQPSLVSYNSTMHQLNEGNCWQRARDLLAMATLHFQPDIISFNCLRGSWMTALQDLDLIERYNLRPSSISFNQCVAALAEDSQWCRGIDKLKDALKKGKATTVTWNSSIASCEAGSWSVAVLLLVFMRSWRFATVESVSSSISACREAGHWEKAMVLLHSEDVRADVIAFNSTISTFEVLEKWTLAIQTLAQIVQHWLVPDILSFNSCMISCPWQIALEFLSLYIRPSVVTYNSVLHACAKGMAATEGVVLPLLRAADVVGFSSGIQSCQSWHQSLAVFMMMTMAALQPNVICYQALLRKCSEGQQWLASLLLTPNSSDTMDVAMEACEKCSEPFIWSGSYHFRRF